MLSLECKHGLSPCSTRGQTITEPTCGYRYGNWVHKDVGNLDGWLGKGVTNRLILLRGNLDTFCGVRGNGGLRVRECWFDACFFFFFFG